MEKIEHLRAFIAVDEDGDEGLMAAELPDASGELTFMPLVASSESRWAELEPIGLEICEREGIEFEIVDFVRVDRTEPH